MSAFTVAILAGGQSSRMGADKSFVPVLGRPMIEHVLARLADLGQAETILVTNRPDAYAYLALPTYTDVIPAKGALGGIYSALHYSPSPYTLVLACDMPFVSSCNISILFVTIFSKFSVPSVPPSFNSLRASLIVR